MSTFLLPEAEDGQPAQDDPGQELREPDQRVESQYAEPEAADRDGRGCPRVASRIDDRVEGRGEKRGKNQEDQLRPEWLHAEPGNPPRQ